MNDVVIEKRVLVEIRAAKRGMPIHEAQLRPYLRHSRATWDGILRLQFSVLNHGIGERTSK